MPLSKGKPKEIRTELQQNLLDCDALIIIYGQTTAAWVREQLRFSRKIGSRRPQPLLALAVYEGPPEKKEDLAYYLPNMQMLDCRKGLDQTKLEKFLHTVKQGEKA